MGGVELCSEKLVFSNVESSSACCLLHYPVGVKIAGNAM